MLWWFWPRFALHGSGETWTWTRGSKTARQPVRVVFDNPTPEPLTVHLGEEANFEVPAGAVVRLGTEPGDFAFTTRDAAGRDLARVAATLEPDRTYIHDASGRERYFVEELAFSTKPERLKPRIPLGGATFLDAGWISHVFLPAPKTVRGAKGARVVVRRLLRDRADVLLDDAIDHPAAEDRRAELTRLATTRGDELEPLVPLLIERLGGPRARESADVRAFLVEVLGLVHARPSDALPALGQALSDPELEVRARAARAIGDFGPAASAWGPELVARLLDGSALVRLEVLDALGVIAPDDATSAVAPVLLEVFGAEQEGHVLRATAARALGALPHAPAARDLVAAHEASMARLAAATPATISYYDRDPGVVLGAREALWLLDRDAYRALSPLPRAVEALLFEDLATRARRRDEDPSTVEATLALAADEALPLRRRAVRALAWAGPKAPREATGPLAAALSSRDRRLVATAAMALAWLDRRDALPALEAQREHPDPHARRAVLRALEDLGP